VRRILSLFNECGCLSSEREEKRDVCDAGIAKRELSGAPRGLASFPLQKGLIFERMPLTADVPVSLPAVARLPRLPVT
jgi:hypothetical protein